MNRDAHLVTWIVHRCGRNLTAIRHRLIAVETRITTSRESPSEPSKSVLAKFFFDRFAGATITTVGIRKQPLRYFIGRILIRREQIVLASYYHTVLSFSSSRMSKQRSTMEKARAHDRKREFGTSPSGADGGESNRSVGTATETGRGPRLAPLSPPTRRGSQPDPAP